MNRVSVINSDVLTKEYHSVLQNEYFPFFLEFCEIFVCKFILNMDKIGKIFTFELNKRERERDKDSERERETKEVTDQIP